jgi:XTP/dITP diphosphohydrolase
MHKNSLLFASSNAHKLEEIRRMLPPAITLLGFNDINWSIDIPEPFDTFEENACAKAGFVMERTGLTCFAEDSGLVIDALGGRPGVLSARYAGEHGDAMANNQKVLEEMDGESQRSARYVAVIAYIEMNKTFQLFRGEVEGSITTAAFGNGGFGYDPIFIPAGFNQTFAELPARIKQSISHRRKALDAFIRFLQIR